MASPTAMNQAVLHGKLAGLDGLRGLAALAVVLHHTNAFTPLTHAGWVGVDLFFVLSGFLITRSLLSTWGTPGALGRFYVRRALRLLPLYLVTVATLLFLGNSLGFGASGVARLSSSQGFYWLHATNFLVAGMGTWDAAPLNTSHFWSLAMEEQFYALWPLALLVLEGRVLRRTLLGLVFLAPIIRAGLVWAGEPLAAYVLLPARLDALAMGGLLATWLIEPESRGVRNLHHLHELGTVALGGLLGLALWNRRWSTADASTLTLGLTLLAFVAAATVGWVVRHPGSKVVRALEWRPLATVGTWSYGVYVLHFPAIHWVREVLGLDASRGTGSMRILALGVQLALTLVLSWGAWRLIEAPLQSLGTRLRNVPARRHESLEAAPGVAVVG